MNAHLPQQGIDLIQTALNEVGEVGDPLDSLIEATRTDPEAPFAPEILERLLALKASAPGRFTALRGELKTVGCRMGRLDDALARAEGKSGGRGPSQADLLLELAQEADLFHTTDRIPYADVVVDGHRETWAVRARGFRHWLLRRFFVATGGAPNSEALSGALGALEARAIFAGPERPVFVRVGEQGGRIYLDLADSAWQAVEIDAGDWRVVDAPPVRFRRAAGMKPLPVPERGGSVEALRRFLNVRGEADFVLVISWLLAALRPRGPYPLLALSGEQGSAKSTFSAVLRALVDPATAALRALPREDRDLFIAAGNGHLLAFDNLSGLSSGISDTLCRLATGGGFAVRALYSDQDEVLFEAARPILLNGIEDVVSRADLADRAILLQLEPIPDDRRRPEAEIWAEFERERPRILGALLDALVEGLRRLPDTRLPRLPRMADFALWASACETALWPRGTFWEAYEGNRMTAVESVIGADPVGSALRAFMTDKEEWTGTAATLLPLLADVAGERTAKSNSWPQSPRALSGRLRRAATVLRKTGIGFDFLKGKGRSPTRLIQITSNTVPWAPENVAQQPSEPSEPSALERMNSAHNHFGAPGRRTVGVVSDGRIANPLQPSDATHRRCTRRTVRTVRTQRSCHPRRRLHVWMRRSRSAGAAGYERGSSVAEGAAGGLVSASRGRGPAAGSGSTSIRRSARPFQAAQARCHPASQS
jgi:hypothetical protein